MAPITASIGAKGYGSERAAARAAMQYRNVPRKMPSVHCVTRSWEKLTIIRGENCMEASVSDMSRMAKTIDTTVMIDAAIPARMIWATWGSECEGKIAFGTHSLSQGNSSSSHERSASAQT